MKLINKFFLIVALITVASCSSDDSSDGTNGQANLKLLKSYSTEFNGQVFNIASFIYEGDRVVEVTFQFDEKIIYTYNNDQLVLEEQFNYNFANQQYNVFEEQTTFQYEGGVLFSDKAVYDIDTDAHNKHKYNLLANGKISKYDYYGQDEINGSTPSGGSRIFTYNQSNIISESQTNGEGDEMFRIERTFDDKKNPLHDANVDSTRQIWGLYLSPMSDNNMLTRNAYDNDNELYWSLTYTYEYDEDGYPISREAYNNLTQEVEEVITFEYYD